MNTFVIDLKKGVSYSNPYINKFSHEFDSVEFVIDGDDMLNDCAFAVVYFIEGNTGMAMENGGSVTKEYNSENGKISLIWTLDRRVSCDDGVVLYQVVAYKQQDGSISAVWYSPQGRIVVGDSIDTTEYETLQIGSEPSLVSQFLVMANSNKTDIDILKESINTLEQTANQLDEKTYQNAQSIMLNSENISSLNNKTDAMDSELSKVGDIANSNTQSITLNEQSISSIQTKVKSIDSELSNVKQTAYSNNDEILIHQSRLDEADNSINNINSNISDIISRVESNKTNINQNLDKINDTRSIAADNQKNINANSKSINDVSILVDGVVSDLNGKVDKVEGMGLSQNSFTDSDKQLLESVNKKPGIITDNGGEVFNDYTSNVAGGRYTTAKGKGTVAASDVVYEVKNIAFNGYDANVIIVNDKESLSNIKIGDVISGEFEYDIDIGGFVEPGGTKQFTAKVVSIDYEEVRLDRAVASSNLNPWIVKSSSVTGTRYNIQNVDGMYNIEDTDCRYLHITGNGESDANRGNAYTLDKNGVAWFKGGIKIGGIGQDDGIDVDTRKWEMLQSKEIAEQDGELSELRITFPEGYKEYVVSLERTAPTASSNTIIYPYGKKADGNGELTAFWDYYEGSNASHYEFSFLSMGLNTDNYIKLDGYIYALNQPVKGKPQTMKTSGWINIGTYGNKVSSWHSVTFKTKLNVGSKYKVWGCK